MVEPHVVSYISRLVAILEYIEGLQKFFISLTAIDGPRMVHSNAKIIII